MELERVKKNKIAGRYFVIALTCLCLLITQQLFGFFNFAREPDLLMKFICGIGIISEMAGFYFNYQRQHYTDKEIIAFLGVEKELNMQTPEEMLQFAKRNQEVVRKQHKKAFQAIAEEILPEEKVLFSMMADNLIVNENQGNRQRPWYVSVAVTNERLLICGEVVRGMLLTSYQTECYRLKEIHKAEQKNGRIMISFLKNQLIIEGGATGRMFDLLNTLLSTSMVK